MSGRKASDYKAVFSAVRDTLQNIQVLEFVVDFESAMWAGLKYAFPGKSIKGCIFHLVQAIYRNVQQKELTVSYSKDRGTYTFIRQLMALPFIPHEHISPMFYALKQSIQDPRLVDLCQYIEDTWICSSVWPPSTWSVFNQTVRTNNDVEGWHNRLNTRAGRGQIQFYLLLDLPYEESKYVNIQVKLVPDNNLQRCKHVLYRNLDKKLVIAWEKFGIGELTTRQLLRTCSQLYGPVE